MSLYHHSCNKTTVKIAWSFLNVACLSYNTGESFRTKLNFYYSAVPKLNANIIWVYGCKIAMVHWRMLFWVSGRHAHLKCFAHIVLTCPHLVEDKHCSPRQNWKSRQVCLRCLVSFSYTLLYCAHTLTVQSGFVQENGNHSRYFK